MLSKYQFVIIIIKSIIVNEYIQTDAQQIPITRYHAQKSKRRIFYLSIYGYNQFYSTKRLHAP